MMEDYYKYLDNLDIYEVDKIDWQSYRERMRERQLMCKTPKDGITIYQDVETGLYVCGTEVERIMGQQATRYFIFELLDEDKLVDTMPRKYITLDLEEYEKFIKTLTEKAEKNNG